MSPRFFLNDDLGLKKDEWESWDIVEVGFGASTGWTLSAKLADRHGGTRWVLFDDPVSFRVQDEREMLDYWGARDAQNAGIGALYTILDSSYLKELGTGLTALTDNGALTHFLLAGENTCLEVITLTRPRASEAPPEPR